MIDRWKPTAEPLVLHVIPTPAGRGAQREARALADELDAPGLRIHRVLSLFDGPHEVETDFSLRHPGGDNPAAGFNPRLVLRLRAGLARLAPDVVVAHGGDPLKYLVPAMFFKKRPLAYYAIGTYAGPANRRWQLALWKRLVARADVVAAEGQEVQEECQSLLGIPPERVFLAPNGRDPDVFTSRPPRAETPACPLVVFVGALTVGKRPDRFLEVIGSLRAQGLALAAQLIGDGPLRNQLVLPAEAAGVELLGWQSDVAKVLYRADVLVFPSLPSGEGMPGVLIEAGLAGVPVVATAVPGVNTIVAENETGLIVPVDDLPAMVRAVANLLGDPDLRLRLGQAARKRCVDRFSLAAVAAQWLRLLKPLLTTGYHDPPG